ncbi:hypothetical protein [Parapedobacter sp. 10938]|uniref:hypothetical protein n=1 Tax=Parapedobacter flavus TaxID=3110225 RepID=UPI002DBAAEC9|nr:hypothetical protein [Parapedobacter sp. 10938]MEC3879789.1 hypothetical protein [Parapedobacter sp. 10938]
MKKLFLPFLAVCAIGFVTSCSKDGPAPGDGDGDGGEELVKTGVITEDETWTAENVYILDGRVVVDEGVTLTIQAGTIVKAEDGQEANASALIVDQGARLLAEGTASKPIILTSVNDNIQPGETESTLELADAGQWGGLILLGRAPISVSGASGTALIEGIPAGLSYGTYGGDDAVDEFAPGQGGSKLNYISIRFSGVALKQDSEIQGLTLGGVGSATSIKNIEIYSNLDDGIEAFGGNVNIENLLVIGQQDDGIDLDQSYAGTVSNAFVIQTAESGSGLEIDGPEGDMEASFTLRNITIDAGNFEGKLIADFRSRAMGTLENIYVYNINATGATVNVADATTGANYNANKLIFKSWELVLPSGKSVSDLFTADASVTDNAAFAGNATGVAAGSETVGADLSVFGWTYAKSTGAF